jgi:hypothetical protein
MNESVIGAPEKTHHAFHAGSHSITNSADADDRCALP